MISNRFEWALLVRVVLLAATMLLCLYFVVYTEKYVSGVIVSLLVIYQIYELYQYVLETNRKLTRFLEAVRYADFTAGFNKDSKLGQSFRELNQMFNEVFDAFRKARAEKEEHWQYLRTVVQHVGVGLLSYDESGNVELFNNTARRYLGASQLNNIQELAETNPAVYQSILKLMPGTKTLVKPSNDLHLSINATELRLRGTQYKLISIQNILSELQQQEIESWQNLTRVLRHEIMNSITPIASLAGTAIDIIQEDVVQQNGHLLFDQEAYDDINMSLRTIENRSRGLVTFVDAYRNFTSIPQPQLTRTPIKKVVEEVIKLIQAGLADSGIVISMNIEPPNLVAHIDIKLIEMVLINVLKNATEALSDTADPRIEVSVYTNANQNIIIDVTDNGSGIEPEALERIFIPFYTTKNTGSGIGLSLSQRIMQMHQGNLLVQSEVGEGTTFSLQL